MKVTIEYIGGGWDFLLEYPDGSLESFTLTDEEEAAQAAHDLIGEMLEVMTDGDDGEDEDGAAG